MTEQKIIDRLWREVAKVGSIREWSRDHGISHVYVWRTLTEDRPLSDNVAAVLGYERVMTWRKIRG